MGGFPLHRAVVLDEGVVGQLAQLVFGPGTGGPPDQGPAGARAGGPASAIHRSSPDGQGD